ncbi:MAG: hypothetical protein J1F02_02755 [Lachnospiraceae bacterium]|nr:hypothetical protein [Lachnospiraceae bacterium]
MIIQIIGSEKLDFLKDKTCIEKCLNKYQNYPSNKWLIEMCDGTPFIDTKFENIKDFELDMSADKSKAFETEFENVKRVYGNLKFLTDSMASDERLWAALCIGPFYEYVRYRWKIDSVNNVLQHYFFEQSGKRGLTRNAISRLWWIGRLTYDKNRTDKYELTRFVCGHSDYIMHFIERNTSNNLHVMRPFLEAIMEARERGFDLNTDDAGNLAKYLNLLGGVYILDFMPEEWIKDKIRVKIDSMFQTSFKQIENENMSITNNENVISAKSKIVLENVENHHKVLISAKKNRLITKPANLIGLKVGDSVRIGKLSFIIAEIL